MGRKKRGFGLGQWNGFGGKIEKGESFAEGAKRELYEESSLIAKDLKHVGVVKYEVQDESLDQIVHVFTCNKYEGTEKPSDEMDPVKWFRYDCVPYDKMWPDARTWWPSMLNDKYFSVHCVYNRGKIISTEVLEHDSIKEALNVFNFMVQ